MGVEGWVDTVGPDVVTGWAADRKEPGVPVALDVVSGGTVRARILADVFRPDLRDVGFPPGFHGFVYPIPAGCEPASISFRPTGQDAVLPLSVAARAKPKRLEGRVDLNAAGEAAGWAFDPDDLSASVILEVSVSGRVVVSGPTTVPRGDVAAIYGCGPKAGFVFSVPVDAGEVVLIRAVGGGIPLEGSGPQSAASGGIGSFDGLSGSVATGWAWNPAVPGGTAVEFLVGGRIVGRACASLYREDVALSGCGGGMSGFRTELDFSECGEPPFDVDARLERGSPLRNSPLRSEEPALSRRWRRRVERVRGPLLDRVRRWCTHRAGGEVVSLIMPVYETPEAWLREAIDSVLAQWSGSWELVCVDDASPSPHVATTLGEYAATDSRVRVVTMSSNSGIAAAVNAGAACAQGTCVAFMDHDDVLEPDAVHWLAQAMRTGADMAYTDEVVTGESSKAILTLGAAPAFSYDYYLSHPYFVHLVCVRRALFEAAGGWNAGMAISADVDFVLHAVEHAALIAHVAAPLYRWRTHAGSAGHSRSGAVMEATGLAIRRHLDRCGWPNAAVSDGPTFNQFRIGWPDPGGTVLVVILSRDRGDLLRACIESLLATTFPDDVRVVIVDHSSTEPEAVSYLALLADRAEIMKWSGAFNYSAMNNAAVAAHGEGCAFVLLLNNDVEATGAGWVSRMRSLAGRPGVGAVGATLVYPDGTVQHAGVVVGLNGLADHAHKFQPLSAPDGTRNPGHLGSLSSVRDWSAVTGACMMLPMTAYAAMGGLDETFEVGFNDTDLCLRLGAASMKVLSDPFSVLIHRESATRLQTGQVGHPEDSRRFAERWSGLITAGDPFYSPYLDLSGPDHAVGSARGPGPTIRVRSSGVPRRAAACAARSVALKTRRKSAKP